MRRGDVGVLHALEGAGEPTNLSIREGDDARRNRVERVIRTDANILSRADLRAALADEDVPDFGLFAGVELHTQPLTV